METIEVRIGKDGNINIKTSGFKGKTCMKFSNFLLDGFGQENIKEQKKTSEYWEQEPLGEHHGIRNGN